MVWWLGNQQATFIDNTYQISQQLLQLPLLVLSSAAIIVAFRLKESNNSD